jgi:hypothetical protein
VPAINPSLTLAGAATVDHMRAPSLDRRTLCLWPLPCLPRLHGNVIGCRTRVRAREAKALPFGHELMTSHTFSCTQERSSVPVQEPAPPSRSSPPGALLPPRCRARPRLCLAAERTCAHKPNRRFARPDQTRDTQFASRRARSSSRTTVPRSKTQVSHNVSLVGQPPRNLTIGKLLTLRRPFGTFH